MSDLFHHYSNIILQDEAIVVADVETGFDNVSQIIELFCTTVVIEAITHITSVIFLHRI